jgi:hypothetical protein
MSLGFAMAAVLITWCFVTVILVGLGCGLTECLRLSRPSGQYLLSAFWLGFALLLFLLQCWHFVFRVSALPWLFVSVAAMPGIWNSKQRIVRVLADGARHRFAFAFAILAVLYVANRSIGPCVAFDSGLYGQPAINWFVRYPVIKGLANLNERFGFNNSVLLFYAMLDHGFWRNRTNQIVSGLLLCALLIQVIWNSARLSNRDNRDHSADLYDAILLIPALFIATDHEFFNIASVGTDPTVSIMVFVAASRLFRMLMKVSANPVFDGFFVIVVAISATTVKLSALAFSATAALLVFWSWFGANQIRRPVVKRAVASSAAVTAILIATWMARGILLSGYALYPSAIGTLGVDWQVPRSVATRERGFIKEFSHYYYDPRIISRGQVRGAYLSPAGGWHRQWLLHLGIAKGEIVIPAALAALGLVFLLVAAFRPKTKAHILNAGALVIVPALGLLAQGVFLAPSPRFLFAGLWILAATVLGLGVRPFLSRFPMLRPVSLLVVCLIAGTFLLARSHRHLVCPDATIPLCGLLYAPGPDHGFYPIPKADFTFFETRSGLIVSRPTKDGRIWNGPLLSAPEPDSGLELRARGSLVDGFRTVVTTPGPNHL